MLVGITQENVHYWQGTQVLADIPDHGLKYFKSWDDLVNYLYVNGFKHSARHINNELKKGNK